MTLYLVGRKPPKPKRKKYARAKLLSDDEERRFRQAMRNLRDNFGSWTCLSAAMNATFDAVRDMMSMRTTVSGELVVKAMRASGLGLKDLIGEPAKITRCHACGSVRRAS